MPIIVGEEEDLLTAVYDGPFDQPLWSTFLDRLRARTRATYAGIIFRPPGWPSNTPLELFSGERFTPELQRLYEQELYKNDPIPLLTLRENRVYSVSEMLDQGDPQHRDFYRTLLVPGGLGQMRTLRVVEPSGVNAWLTIGRRKPDFSAVESALLSRLAPHFQRSLRNYVAIEQQRYREQVTAEAMQRLNFGWFSLDSASRIVESSAPAERLLQQCAELKRDRHGRLFAARPALDRELTEAVRACRDNPRVRPRAFHIGREPWIDMLLVPASNRTAAATSEPVAIAYLQGDNWSAADRHEQIAEMFGLLPSEARLALALTRGLSIVEAASDLGITIETARNYSKRIYAKTGARGQADLIRIILTSVLALA